MQLAPVGYPRLEPYPLSTYDILISASSPLRDRLYSRRFRVILTETNRIRADWNARHHDVAHQIQHGRDPFHMGIEHEYAASDEQQAGRNLADDHAHLIAVRHGELSFSFQAKRSIRRGSRERKGSSG